MSEPSELQVTDKAFVDIAESISSDGPTFTERESLVLSLYDQLHELRLEYALLEAQLASKIDLYSIYAVWYAHWLGPAHDSSAAEVSESDVKLAKRQYLEARATYMLQKSIVENVMISDPILKAVHSAPTANPVEMYETPRSSFQAGNC